jgi:hypothetical protein
MGRMADGRERASENGVRRVVAETHAHLSLAFVHSYQSCLVRRTVRRETHLLVVPVRIVCDQR